LLAKNGQSRMVKVPALSLSNGSTITTNKGDQHMKKTIRYVGLDVHKDTIVIAVADEGREGDEARQREDGTALTPPD